MSVIGVFVVVSTYGFAIKSTYDEDKNGSLLFLKGLPISDTDIVLGKFVSTLFVTALVEVLLALVAVVGECFIVPKFGPQAPVGLSGDMTSILRSSLYTIAAFSGVSVIMAGIYLSMFFCLGYGKAQAYNRFVMLGLFASAFAGGSIISRSLPEAEIWLMKLGQSTEVPLVVGLAGLAVYLAGCLISIMRVRSRDWS